MAAPRHRVRVLTVVTTSRSGPVLCQSLRRPWPDDPLQDAIYIMLPACPLSTFSAIHYSACDDPQGMHGDWSVDILMEKCLFPLDLSGGGSTKTSVRIRSDSLRSSNALLTRWDKNCRSGFIQQPRADLSIGINRQYKANVASDALTLCWNRSKGLLWFLQHESLNAPLVCGVIKFLVIRVFPWHTGWII